jgi:hypothetical protein
MHNGSCDDHEVPLGSGDLGKFVHMDQHQTEMAIGLKYAPIKMHLGMLCAPLR